MKKAIVDFGKRVRTVRPMHAVNNGPIQSIRGNGNFDDYVAAGIPYMRNHDAAFCANYGGDLTVDVENIFRRFDADENDPASYDFVMTDQYSTFCTKTGGEVFYRLGSKIEHEIKKYHTRPPKDYAKYARICEHIIRHLTEGWADGLRLPITYWEIWNEADNYHKGGWNPCWQGTEEQFLEFYEVMAKHLKGCFPHLKIGGPAYTHSREGGGDAVEHFLRYVKEHDVPLDFFSYHGYATEPSYYVNSEKYTRMLLERYGLAGVETILDEWNYVIAFSGEAMRESYLTLASEKGAAFAAACMLAMQKTTLDMFMYYDFRPSSFSGPFDPYTREIRKPYWPFWGFNKLYRLGTEVFSENDGDLYLCAAEGKGKKAVMAAYYHDGEIEEEEAEIVLRGLSGKTKFAMYLTDAEHDNALVRRDVFTTEEGSIGLLLKPYSVLILLEE